MRPSVPRLANKILKNLCDERYLEEVQGDLEEIFESNLETLGRKKANRIYWLDVLKHIRPYFIKKRSINLITQNQTAMWAIYLKIALRNFWKSKVVSGINTTGLSIGLACCIIIFFHIKDELSYDTFLEDGDSIYRVLNINPERDQPASAGGPIPLGPTLLSEFSGVEDAVRLWRDYQPTISLEEKVFVENEFLFADENFFNMFSFSLEQGDPKTALSQPNSLILTNSLAEKYFGTEDPMGKTLQYDGGRGLKQLMVTGIMNDLPHNTHFSFDLLASFSTVDDQTNWGSYKPIWTYITLTDGTTPDHIRTQFPPFAKKYAKFRVVEYAGFGFDLEPVSSIYVESRARRNMKPLGNLQSIYVLAAVGICILLIACINFINLTMANSLARFKEVGIRKVMGAGRSQLIRQFLTESGITIVFALGVSVILTALFLPIYNALSGKQIDLIYLLDIEFVAYILLGLVAATLLAGLYPAKSIASLGNHLVVKRASDKVGNNAGIRKGLVVFQFLVSATLIIGVLIIDQQQRYIFSKPLGIDKEQVMVVPTSNQEGAFLQKLYSMPEISSVGISQRLPVNLLNYDGRGFGVEGLERAVSAQSCVIDLDFIETYGIEIIAGRNHFKEPAGTWEYLINESAVKEFEWGTPENALGKKIYLSPEHGMTGKVIGVFKDYHLESLHEKIPPMIMFKNIREDWKGWHREFVSLKYQTDDLLSFSRRIEDLWKSHNDGRAYFSFFIDDSYEQLHEADGRFATLFNYLTFIAMFIACIGLLGISMLIVNQKVKEIGIRKVLGASALNVVLLFSKKFVSLVMIGLILACPVAYYMTERWLQSFSYRIDIGFMPFLMALFILAFLSIVTIVTHTAKAALTNPAESLKDE